jgi:thiamine-monophosphate kinase
VKLSDLGEEQVVARLTRGLPLGPRVRVGAGDDCAVIGGPRDKMWRLLKTDAVVEGVHFLPGENMRRVGWKALCRAISDVAAMGGEPREALVSLAIAPEADFTLVAELYAGLKRAARKFGVSIVGGETSRSPGPLFVSIALTGEVERERCTLRSGGRAGDGLFVTGRLGGTLAAKHLDFTPRLAEARWLTEHFRPRAMMDLSDGLGMDLPRLAGASRCGFELWLDALPRTKGCSVDQALGDGEDFELLFAMKPSSEAPLRAAWPRKFPPLTMIGRLTKESRTAFLNRGYDHFA